MPFPSDHDLYKEMLYGSGVISGAIESLDVQVDWSSAHIVGLSEEDLEPLVHAFDDLDNVQRALQNFTKQMFVFGNLSLFIGVQGTLQWDPRWRDSARRAEYDAALSQGRLVEARHAPVVAGYGTPFTESALNLFKSHLAVYSAQISAMDAFANHGTGVLPSGSEGILKTMNATLDALGFEPWDQRNTPRYREPLRLRDEMREMFVSQLLIPFASATGKASATPDLII